MWVLKVKVISLPYIFQVLFVLCFTWPRYQVSVYRTIGPLVFSMISVKIRWELSEIHGTERLFIDEFGHDFQQPSP